MNRKLREELKKIATVILTSSDTDDVTDLYKAAQTLYEKLAVLKFIDEKLNDIEVDVSSNVIANKFEKMANSVLDANVLADFLGKPEEVQHATENFAPVKETVTKSLNDKLNGKEIKVDLNNRLAFVKHLFNGSTEDYNRVLSQLNTIDTEERSISFIVNMVKPDYDNWEGKEEYVERFMELIERRFS